MMLAREEDIVPPVPAIMAEVKRLSGLTWDQLGKILGVSRRTVHNWTNGETVRPGHLTNLLSLLERIRGLRDMPAFKVRQALLRESGMAESMRVLESNEPPILAADNRSFAHQLEVGPSSLRMKRD
jgi:transcriptional regulator with XRE-family HTH domain